MSIYATLWTLCFPREGEDSIGCEWIEVRAQAVPGHIGTPTQGFGYEDGDPYADFLPSPIRLENESDERLRAVVIVTSETKKGTARNGQEYVDPLLLLTGEAYERVSFAELHERICSALRGDKPRVTIQEIRSDGTVCIHYEDGSSKVFKPDLVM